MRKNKRPNYINRSYKTNNSHTPKIQILMLQLKF